MDNLELYLIDLDMRIFCIQYENPDLDYNECKKLALEEIKEEKEFEKGE